MKNNKLSKIIKTVLSGCLSLSLFTLPVYAATIEEKINIASISASSEYSNDPITKAVDGNYSSFWETNWKGSNYSPSESKPIVVTALLSELTDISKIVIYQRPGGSVSGGDANGRFIKARYTYLDTSGNAIADSFTVNHGTHGVAPGEEPIELEVNKEIGGLKIEVMDAYGPASGITVTMAELEFFKEVKIEFNTVALQAKIDEAIALDTTGKSTASINALYDGIDAAKVILANAQSQAEIDQAVLDLAALMQLEDENFKEVIDVSSTKDLERENNFNRGWLFREIDSDSYSKVLDESQFTSVNLPHDFSIDNDFTTSGEAESGYLLGGTGWYRKHFVVPASAEGKQISLNFDGSYMDTYIYVNGTFVAEHHNGYSQFTVDISEHLIADGATDNVIAIKVVNSIPSSRWYSGSGIYRDVTLFVKEATHIKQDGLFVHTSNVTSSSATVVVENEIENPAGTVKTTIFNKDGNEVASNEVAAAAKTSQSFEITNPELWSVDTYTPALYTVKSEIIVNGEVVDEFSDQFGIKDIRFNRDLGFFLNGESMKLKGVCQHHDQGALGAAANYHAIYRQVKILKDMGCNSIRVTHNPASEALLDACDELGMIVINEMFDGLYHPKNGNSYDFSRWFNQAVDTKLMGANSQMTWAEYSARQTVRMSRNHASVILYSIGNEVQEGVSGNCSGYPEKIREICTWMKDEDPYTLPTVGSNKLKGGNSIAISYSTIIAEEFGGPIGFNYATTSQMESLRNAHPTWVVYGSETSSAHHSRDVYYTQGQDDVNKLTTDYENESSRAGWGHSASTAWKIATETTWNMGEYVWTGFDYIGEPTPWNNTNPGGSFPAARSSTFGIVETNGLWKDIAYLYHSFWNEEERTLHVTDSWTADMGSTVLMQVFSDADKVELYVNGSLFGSDTSTVQSNGNRYFSNSKFHAEFNVPFAAGTVEVKAYDLVNGSYVEVTDTVGVKKVTTPGTATTTTLTADRMTLDSDGYELAYIEINVVDENGNICTEFNNTVNIAVEGEGKLVGVDSGKQSEMQSYRIDNPKRHTKAVFNGKLIAIVQSTRRSGDINVSVSGSGLTTQTITLNAQAQSEATDIVSFEYVSKYALFENETLDLPETILVVMENGNTADVAVNWNLDQVNTTKAGIYTSVGTLENSDVQVKATVTVYGSAEAAQNYSSVYHEGSLLELPAETKVYAKDGSELGVFPIVWSYYDANEYHEGDKVTIQGRVQVASKTMPIVAKLRVAAPLPEAENYARSTSDAPRISQSCTNIADNINSLNNGVTNSTDANQRWTDWNQQGDQVVWVQYEWNNKYTFDSLVAYMWMDGNGCQEPKNMDYSVQYKDDNGNWVDTPVTYITPVAYYEGTGETTISILTPVTTNGLRLTMDKRQKNIFTGMTELKAMEYVERVPNETNATMTSINLNGNVVDTTNGTTFDIEADDVTTLEVSDVNVASTATYVVLRDDATNTLRIITRAEDGTNQTYTFTLQTKEVVDTTALQAKIQEASAILPDTYTSDSYAYLQTAITSAQNVLANPTTQDDVDAAIIALQTAMNGLVALPQKVTNLTTKCVNYKTIQLTWDAQVGVTYEVYRQNTKTGLWILLTSTTENTYTVNGVKTGLEYTYKVVTIKTIDGTQVKVESDEVKGKALLTGKPALTLTNASSTVFTLTWTPVEGATRYIIYRKYEDGEYKKVLTLGKDVTTYTSYSMMPGTYSYIVKAARYDSKDRVFSEEYDEVVGLSGCVAPVISLTKLDTKSIELTWEAVDGMKYYEIYRAQADGVYRRWKVTTETLVVNRSLKPGTYSYKVRAYRIHNGNTVYSPDSNVVSVTME